MTMIKAEVLAAIEKSLTPLRDVPKGYLKTGRLLHVGATLLKAYLPGVFMGEVCCLLPEGALAEVVGIDGATAQLSPLPVPEACIVDSRCDPWGGDIVFQLGKIS